MFQLLIAANASVVLELLCVFLYHVGTWAAEWIWHHTAAGAFPSRAARSSYDFLVRWYFVLFGELVFVVLRPSSPSFAIVLVLTRARDFLVRSGYWVVAWEALAARVAAVDSRVLRRLGSCRPRSRDACPTAAELAELWYRRWQACEVMNLSDVAASVTVLLALCAEVELERRGLGMRLLSLHVTRDHMWQLWVGFAFIVLSQVLTSVAATLVHRRRLAALVRQVKAEGGEPTADVGLGRVADTVVVLAEEGPGNGSPALGGQFDAELGGRVLPQPLPDGGGLFMEQGVTREGSSRRQRFARLWAQINNDSPAAAPLFWLRDPALLTVTLYGCTVFAIAKVYQNRAFELLGELAVAG